MLQNVSLPFLPSPRHDVHQHVNNQDDPQDGDEEGGKVPYPVEDQDHGNGKLDQVDPVGDVHTQFFGRGDL